MRPNARSSAAWCTALAGPRGRSGRGPVGPGRAPARTRTSAAASLTGRPGTRSRERIRLAPVSCVRRGVEPQLVHLDLQRALRLGHAGHWAYSEVAGLLPHKSGGVSVYASEAWKSRFSFVGPVATFGYWFAWWAVSWYAAVSSRHVPVTRESNYIRF